MRTRSLQLVVAAVAALSLAFVDGATLRTEQVYFHCATDQKLANVDYLQSSTLPTWDTEPPTGSVADGEGCGWADNSAFRSTQAGNSAHDGAWDGVFTGNLDSITVQVHSISAGPGRSGAAQTFRATLVVDGESVFGYDADGRAARRDVRLVPVESGTKASSLYEFTITDLPFVAEAGDGTTEWWVTLNLAAASEPLMGWVYDTTEVPSGMVFNPEAPADVTIRP